MTVGPRDRGVTRLAAGDHVRIIHPASYGVTVPVDSIPINTLVTILDHTVDADGNVAVLLPNGTERKLLLDCLGLPRTASDRPTMRDLLPSEAADVARELLSTGLAMDPNGIVYDGLATEDGATTVTIPGVPYPVAMRTVDEGEHLRITLTLNVPMTDFPAVSGPHNKET
jgi:hypothetical protein